MKLKISIADICIEFISSYDFQIQDRFVPFLDDKKKVDITALFLEQTQLPEFQKNLVFCSDNYKVFYENTSNYWRCFYDRVHDYTYYAACTISKDCSESLILYKKEALIHLNHLNGAMYHICWEKHLLNYNRFILHAACIQSDFGGILFTGPSGIGKSTQAELWCRYEGATQLNGDRPIIGKTNSQWKAYGSPYAGSSNCFINASVPAAAIVILGQGTSCKIRKLKPKEAFQKILEQTTVNQWEQESMNKSCDLIIDLISEVPVYELICTSDRDAVECLKKVLQGGMPSADE